MEELVTTRKEMKMMISEMQTELRTQGFEDGFDRRVRVKVTTDSENVGIEFPELYRGKKHSSDYEPHVTASLECGRVVVSLGTAWGDCNDIQFWYNRTTNKWEVLD